MTATGRSAATESSESESNSRGGDGTRPETGEDSADRRPGWVRARPLAATRASYAALYAVDGAMLPFFSVFLAFVHGLDTAQIGVVLAVSSAAAVIAPPALTVAADRYGRAETLFLFVLAVSAIALSVFAFVGGYWWVVFVYAAFSLAREPTRPLLDGIFFASQRHIRALAEVSYHQVRIWGTVGYMVPGVLLYFVLTDRHSLWFLPLVAAGLATLGVAVAAMLPTGPLAGAPGARIGDPGRDGAGEPEPPRETVTLTGVVRAAGALLRVPSTAVFVVAMFWLQVAVTAYSTFYPLMVTEVVGLSPRWLGLVTNLGVLVEIAYMGAFGWLVRRLGWRWLMVLGAATAAVRVALLAAFPTVGVVVGTQLVHGMIIIVSMVAGRVILDRRAPDAIRHTTQGLYAMLVLGGGRIVGSAFGGLVASHDLSRVFWAAALAALVATLGLAWSLRGERPVAADGSPL
ncbi:MFS transporter [Actinopolymorpha singaporensis]|uniref:MFS transporter, PPP family, 3-phenylpropionic acid transporter n=1 Tax=Actinopolymorpha singaporensis TaxID=117157 RepID=A0A1H1QFF8_9ACTN|nr:MFS transporter [Actinopolymorpha singaporensis]SDS22027.1 MFS transporter, PPP family, 3-phenylpropionic acid transporter [Actinopolymorpha singaporensis]